MANGLPFYLYALLFCAGVISHGFLPNLISGPLLAAGLAFTLLLGIRYATVCCVFALLLGVAWANTVAASVLSRELPAELEGEDLRIEGRIIGVPEYFERYVRFDFQVDKMLHAGSAHDSPGRIRLKVYDAEKIYRAGQAWVLSARLKRPRGYMNPGQRFDYETWLFQSRIRATGYVIKERDAVLVIEDPGCCSISALRQRLHEQITERFSGHPMAGVLSALTVGVRSNITREQWEVFHDTGTIHLVAISGLHIGLVTILVLVVVRRLLRYLPLKHLTLPHRVLATLAGLLAGFCYALLAGMTIPTRRAIITVAVLALALGTRRHLSRFEPLCLAMAAVLVLDPLSPFSHGFWLSFWAVFLILGLVSPNAAVPQTTLSSKLSRGARNLFAVQVALSLGMVAPLLLVFSKLFLVSPLANLVAVPVVSLATVPAALAGLCAMLLGVVTPAHVLMDFSLWTLSVVWQWLEYLGNLPWRAEWIPQPPLVLVVFFFAGVAGLLRIRYLPARLVCLTWLLPVFLYVPERPAHGAYRFTLLDVGHGLASVVQTRHHTLVYDFGPGPPIALDSGEAILTPYLHNQGRNRIDIAIVSHAHLDHRGGYESVVKNFPVSRTLSGMPSRLTDAQKCTAGQSWEWDGVRFNIIWPPFELKNISGANNQSCVVQITSPLGSLLLTGDIEAQAELALVERHGSSLRSDVMVVPHQGSKTSSTPRFLREVKPQLGIISSGYRNRFRHPHKVVLERYASYSIPILRTDQAGAITVDFVSNLSVKSERKTKTGYWYN